MKKIRFSLTEDELLYLQHIMWNFTDYMAYDDRPDHGFGRLKGYRDMDDEKKHMIYRLAGRLRRTDRKLREKKYTEKNGTD